MYRATTILSCLCLLFLAGACETDPADADSTPEIAADEGPVDESTFEEKRAWDCRPEEARERERGPRSAGLLDPRLRIDEGATMDPTELVSEPTPEELAAARTFSSRYGARQAALAGSTVAAHD